MATDPVTEIRDSGVGRGLGVFAVNPINRGQEILCETPAVIGPKPVSTLVCVECLIGLDDDDEGFPTCSSKTR